MIVVLGGNDLLHKVPRVEAFQNMRRIINAIQERGALVVVGEIDVPWAISWADEDRDVSTWLGNDMQIACFNELRDIEREIKKQDDNDLLHAWRLLQTSDHLYYVSTKGFEDGNVHAYFSPYDAPYDGFINYMNILQDLKQRVM